jgi:serine/threonine protein kinase
LAGKLVARETGEGCAGTGMNDPTQIIGRYQISRELGRGTMGVVFLAHDPDLGRDIALKVIQLQGGVTDEDRAGFEQRFFAEARSAARLSHPGIVTVHDVGRDGASGAPFMALQFVPGQTLDSLLREKKRLEPKEALRIARGVAKGLQHAHSHGVIHRDIKPANIMILPSGEPIITDFGIAKMEASRLTASGHLVGTPLYMSPEQALVRPVDGRSDIFSLGSVLYEMLTGVAAFAGPSVTNILLQLIHDEPKAPTTLIRTLSPFTDHVLGRCLAKDPAQRYQTAEDLADDLSDLLEDNAPRSLKSSAGSPVFVRTDPGGHEPWRASTIPGLAPREERVEDTIGPSETPQSSRNVELAIAACGLVVVVVFGLLVRFASPRAQPQTVAEATAPALLATPTPTPMEPQASPTGSPGPVAPAQLVVDFEHTLKSGLLRIFVDDEAVMRQSLGGKVTKRILGIPIRRGRMTETIEIAPGRHTLRVQVSWDDTVKTEEARASFEPGGRKTLRARLGSIGGLRKNLSLDWN